MSRKQKHAIWNKAVDIFEFLFLIGALLLMGYAPLN